MDKQRALLLEAFTRKIVAIGKLRIIDRSNAEDDEYKQLMAAMQQLYVDVGKFADITDVRVSTRHAVHIKFPN